jgi:hypothetical protein
VAVLRLRLYWLTLRRFIQRRGLRWLGWLPAIAVYLSFIAPMRSWNPCDFFGFWIPGQTIDIAGVRNMYNPGDALHMGHVWRDHAAEAPSAMERGFRRGMVFLSLTSTPAMYGATRTLSSGDFKRDYWRYRHVSSLLYCGGILLLMFYLRLTPWLSAPLLYFFTRLYCPYLRDVLDGNNSAALAGATMLSLVLLGARHRAGHALSGIALGLLSTYKPTIVYVPLLVLAVLLNGERRALICFGGGFAAGLAAGLLGGQAAMGPACAWQHWWGLTPNTAFHGRAIIGGVPGRLLRIDNRSTFIAFSGAVAGLTWLSLWWLTRRPLPVSADDAARGPQPRHFPAVAAGTLGLTCYLLSGPLVWGHYFTLAVPTALVAMRPRKDVLDGGVFASFLGFVAACLLAFHTTFRRWGWTDWGNYSPWTFAGCLLASGLVVWDLWRAQRWSSLIRPAPSL